MRITAVEEYGLRCLLDLARKGKQAQLSIPEVAEMEGLSVPYASKLLSILRRAGLVVAERGRGGGFSIAREPESITLYDVLTALGGPLIDPSHCDKYTGQLGTCVHGSDCTVHDLFGSLAGHLKSYLSATTLHDLLNREATATEAVSQRQVVYAESFPANEPGPIEERKN